MDLFEAGFEALPPRLASDDDASSDDDAIFQPNLADGVFEVGFEQLRQKNLGAAAKSKPKTTSRQATLCMAPLWHHGTIAPMALKNN